MCGSMGGVTIRLIILERSDIFVLPSAGEGMPNSLIEAMSCGLACVSTNIGGVRELIVHDTNGLLFKPGNTAALVECLKSLLSGETLATRLCSSARETILKSYTIGQVTVRYMELYRKVMVKPS